MVKLFDHDASSFNFMLDQVGKDLTLNGSTPIRAILSSIPVNVNNHDDKYISTLYTIKQGDMVDYLLSKWLIVSQVNGQRIVKYKGIMRKCNYSIKFNFEGVVKLIPTIIEGKVFDIQEGKYVFLPTGKILVTMQENIDTLAITLDQRFIKMGNAWKVTGIDRTDQGLITLSCDLDLFNADDDMVNEIADKQKYVYVLSIAEAPTATVYVGNMLQLTPTLTLNGIASSKPLLFASSDMSKVTVSNSGLVTSIAEGSSIITVSMVDIPEIQATITITADELIIDNFTYELNGNLTVQTEVRLNQTQIYTAVKKNNGVVVPDATFTFTVIPGDTPANKYTFTVINSTQASIKCLGYTYYIYLRATDDSDATKYVEKYIKLRGAI